MLCSEGPGAIPKSFADGVDAALPLNSFEDDGANVLVKFRFEVGDVIEFDEFDARDEGGKGQPVFLGGRNTDCAKGAAVKRVFKSKDAMFRIWGGDWRVVRARIETRKLEAAFDGFGAAVGKEDAVHAGDFGEFPRERSLEFVVKKIREVNSASRFATNHFDDVRMAVAK